MNSLIAIFIGGGLGSLSRYGVTVLSKTLFKTGFPLGTLLANLFACLLMGVILVYYTEKMEQHSLIKPLLLIGFCGGFSTFSTFSFETIDLIKTGNIYYAIANIVLSIALCLGILLILTRKQII